jgi:hypothetical protein
VPVYATVEKDENVSIAFAGRAHNDLAKVLLEIFLAAFLIRFARSALGSRQAPMNAIERCSFSVRRRLSSFSFWHVPG